MTVAGQPQVSYGFDADDRLTTITQGTSQVGFAYDAAGRRATLTLPNGVNATYTYNNANQLTAITYNQGATLVGDLAYSYDAAGRRSQIGGSLARTNLPSAVASATYNAANRLTNWAGTAQSYDLNGNLTGDGSKTYAWDSRNRLTGLSGGASASFAYDGLDRRTGRTVAGTVTNFLYDGLNPVQELTGTTPKANLITGLGIDEVFTRTDSAGTRNYLTDALGSTLALTDGAGAVQTSYTYAPYGETTVSGAANGNALQYTGRENDGTGLYYYRARYYDPVKSRFAAEDPIGLAGGINQYSYVGGDPLSFSDPEGLLEQGIVNFGAGLGDVILFGQGQRLRDLFDVDGGIDPCSDEYSAGEWAGVGVGLFAGGYTGLRAAGTKAAGKEFSHWIPTRMGGPRSLWNGNYVSTVEHALSDPYRYRFMPRSWKEVNPISDPLDRQLNRIPNVYKGAAAGTAAGGMSAANSGCRCQ